MRPSTNKKSGQKFFVSRQSYWGVEEEDGTVVEIAFGGCDFANPDMLSVKWPRLGEGQEFSDPREAVEAAIKVCDAWRKAGCPQAKIAMGSTGGCTIPFETKEYGEARARAEVIWEKLPKCDECGEVLGKECFSHDLCDDQFCSEACAETNYWSLREQDFTDQMESEDEQLPETD